MGAAPTLILLPGLLSDRLVFDPLIAALNAPGPVVVADYGLADSLADMARLALKAADGPLFVAGHSMGGRVALEMLRLAPDRIAKLCLMDTGVHPLGPGEPAKRQRVIEIADTKGMKALADDWLPPMVHADRLADAAFMTPLFEMVWRMTPHLHRAQIKALVERPDAVPVLKAATCPVLLLVGRQDGWSNVAQHEEMLALVRDGALAVIEDAGHFAPYEQPQAVARAFGRFFYDRL